ncbi:MAG: bifunctional UDP-N-acetylglucosamine diphosphorylase/glucosamine-1-phosphate N-acetyltransferase GlmU [Nitrospirae bacterium]|nr:bifunctional UDP-N-acetylglucosamine diphosphorylase/glucosamine-1-phosphate N-acetyltransferase GlmU [Nitrospirota bacterium]
MKNDLDLASVVLAAGLGTRMKSPTPKVLHRIYGKPIIKYVLDSVKPLRLKKNIVVVGPDNKKIINALTGYDAVFAVQRIPKGTGDALKIAARLLKGFNGTVLVLNGDTPLITAAMLRRLIRIHKNSAEDISMISFIANGAHSYGRVVRDNNRVKAVIEDRDADREQRKIKEVNSGIYAMRSEVLKLLGGIKINVQKGEYYLTDIIGIAVKKGFKVGSHILGKEAELAGVNSREDLYLASQYMKERILRKWSERGVFFIDKSSVFIGSEVEIGIDTILYPNVHIEGKTSIGSKCVIYPNTRIADSRIEDNVTVKDSTLIESSVIKEGASIGPFAHLRPGSVIGRSTRIGNFVEIKKSVIGDGTKAQHISYLGDAVIGDNVNIGAGTITCNYDGREKHKTSIGDNVFIGSDSQLVAPVRVGENAYVGAGSTITMDVPSNALAVSRAAQRNIPDWTLKRFKQGINKGRGEDKLRKGKNEGG